MALINLNLLQQLETQADIGKSAVMSCCYNTDFDSKMSPDVFMAAVKRAEQAESLLKHLRGIHKTATDFAAGNFTSYLEEYEQYADEGDMFNPFDELYYHFESGMISDLPQVIEQYSELLDLLDGFNDRRKKLDEEVDKFFGGIPIYHEVDTTDGEAELVSRNELPEDVINQLDANREIEGISVEYCLDNYNKFYQQCRALIEGRREAGNIQECAQQILLLFDPYTPAAS